MSKELDRLEHLRVGVQYINQDKSPAFISQYEEDVEIIEKTLKDYELLKERTKLDSFECLLRLEEILPRGKELLVPVAKQLNALKIIIVKRVDVQLLKDSKNLNDYNWCVHTKDRALSQGEYDFLKEVFK